MYAIQAYSTKCIYSIHDNDYVTAIVMNVAFNSARELTHRVASSTTHL